MPRAVLALPCGSRSMTSTVLPAWARAAATLTVVVVLPTPPFWFATVSTRVRGGRGTGRPLRVTRLRSSSATAWARGVFQSAPGMDAAMAARSSRSSGVAGAGSSGVVAEGALSGAGVALSPRTGRATASGDVSRETVSGHPRSDGSPEAPTGKPSPAATRGASVVSSVELTGTSCGSTPPSNSTGGRHAKGRRPCGQAGGRTAPAGGAGAFHVKHPARLCGSRPGRAAERPRPGRWITCGRRRRLGGGPTWRTCGRRAPAADWRRRPGEADRLPATAVASGR